MQVVHEESGNVIVLKQRQTCTGATAAVGSIGSTYLLPIASHPSFRVNREIVC